MIDKYLLDSKLEKHNKKSNQQQLSENESLDIVILDEFHIRETVRKLRDGITNKNHIKALDAAVGQATFHSIRLAKRGIIPLEDLLQISLVTIWSNYKVFDPKKSGTKTFWSWKLDYALKKELFEEERRMALGFTSYQMGILRKVRFWEGVYYQEFEAEPNHSDLVEYKPLIDDIIKFVSRAKKKPLRRKTIQNLIRDAWTREHVNSVISLDGTDISNDDEYESELEKLDVEDPDANVEEIIMARDRHSQGSDAWGVAARFCTVDQFSVLCFYFGYKQDTAIESYRRVAKIMDKTKDWVAKQYNAALIMLRAYSDKNGGFAPKVNVDILREMSITDEKIELLNARTNLLADNVFLQDAKRK